MCRGGYKSEEPRKTLENIKLFYESREAIIRLFNDYSSIASKAKYKGTIRKGLPGMSARIVCVTEVLHHLHLKILSPKQMLQKLLIALAQVKAGNLSENLVKKSKKMIYSF